MSLTIQYFNDQWLPDPAGLNWRAIETAELGADSVAVVRAFVRWRAHWGTSEFKIVAWDETHSIAEADYRRDYWELPPQTRSFTAEGRRQRPDVLIAVSLLQIAK